MNNIKWTNESAAARLAWEHVYNIAAGLGAVAITELVYQGALAGSEFLTYNANKLYFALLHVSGASGVTTNTPYYTTYYDEANVLMYIGGSQSAYWDATAAAVRYTNGGNLIEKNIWFARIIANQFSNHRFIGYRLDITP